jgi:hypothetical protein
MLLKNTLAGAIPNEFCHKATKKTNPDLADMGHHLSGFHLCA